MAFFTRPELADYSFKQLSGSTLTLSGNTKIASGGSLRILSGATLSVHGKKIDATGGTPGQVLTLDNNGTIRLMDSAGSGGTGFYDGESPSNITVGGIPAGTDLTNKTFTELFQQLLITYLAPAFTSFSVAGQSTTVEVGTILSGSRTFNWATSNSGNVLPNTITIRDLTAGVDLGNGLANDGSETLSINAREFFVPGTQQWQAQGTNSKSSQFNSSIFTVTAIYPYFWGKVTNPTRPVASNALVNSGNKVLSSSTGTITINFDSTSDDYIWFAIPAISTSKTVWYVNALNNGSIGGAASPSGNLFPDFDSVSVTTVNWTGIEYKVYISNYRTGVNVNMELRNS